MNKILLNKNGRNHIRFFVLKKELLKIPEDDAEKIKLCNALFDDLQDEYKTQNFYFRRNVKKGYSISVWQLEDKFYLVHSIRNEFDTYNTTIYVSNSKDDLINIAEFLVANIENIMNDYKNQILDAKDEIRKINTPVKA